MQGSSKWPHLATNPGLLQRYGMDEKSSPFSLAFLLGVVLDQCSSCFDGQSEYGLGMFLLLKWLSAIRVDAFGLGANGGQSVRMLSPIVSQASVFLGCC